MAQTPQPLKPSLDEVKALFASATSTPTTLAPPGADGFPRGSGIAASSTDKVEAKRPNLVPVYIDIAADLLTPVAAYLKVANGSKYSFLLESITGGESLARYSFVGADPFKTVRTGEGFEVAGDPLEALEKELEPYRYVKLDSVPTFTGGAVGFITYDAIQHFEPVTKPAKPHHNPLPGMPEAFFMLASTIVIFDHIFQSIKIVTHVYLPDGEDESKLPSLYEEAAQRLAAIRVKLLNPETPLPKQDPIVLGNEAVSNVGKAGYEGFVTKLKEHIVAGDIIQAVPSQRLARKTALHPFNVYRHLRRLNPSPYMFYLDCGDVQLVGASPETLCKVEGRKVYNHAIAGTVKRGKNSVEDAKLGAELLASEKDRAEHIMLVDLARNDVNRVCKPETVNVDDLMRLEKFSHVIHITSQISGQLRDDQSRFDAFRSIFPAGTVSGAPKVKAIQLVGGLERERRGVYAGAVGRFDFDRNELDTCIAIRTMTFKDGTVYLQAGGGIVFDSVEEDEYIETINKLKSNVSAIEAAEKEYYAMQQAGAQ
ncbi:anthranilate synthase component [Cutaneotrichosporon oleaginosum]|uniref:anthranilate synthase n=1 Tax=Cutaneotrichosporon oleaginosum TaxID=879819 RepID=A0A0J0XK39_9TREE|nr:anthranilate synthase component [Cutaneotrichosporon oleaginosum]KLT41440.1 anthranilate synthase component [Cutaneotrichosporon oleaginosum]